MLEERDTTMSTSTWWIEWAQETAHGVVSVVEGEKVELFARKCCRLYFQKKMEKEMYFHCCCLAWIVQCIDHGATAGELWEATQRAIRDVGDTSTMSSWIFPKLPTENHVANLVGTATTVEESEERYLDLLLQFWKQFYVACEETHLPTRPNKRQRTHYLYSYPYSSSSASSLDDFLKGSYKLAAVILWSNVHLSYGVASWQGLHDLVYSLAQFFKTLTSDDVQAALAVVGMQYLMQHRNISGLSPCMLLDNYLNRAGESCLSVLKERLNIGFYPLRAAICDHLLEAVYPPNFLSLTEEASQATIQACCTFLNREQPYLFLQQIQEPITLTEERDNVGSGSVPADIQSPRYPLITHLNVWLLDNDMSRAIDLARRMDSHPHLDGLWKDEAYLRIWQHLLNHGQLFLDGNYAETIQYMDRRELLYNGIVNGMGLYGCGSMMDFYQALAQKVWDHPLATPEEKSYILLACQQTLLRLWIKCRGLSDNTVVTFIQNTKWPVAVQEVLGIPSTDIQIWAAKFLSQKNPIPESLLFPIDSDDDDGCEGRGYRVVNLDRLVEDNTLPSPTEDVHPEKELQPRELLTEASQANQQGQAFEQEDEEDQAEVVDVETEEEIDDDVVENEYDDDEVEAQEVDEAEAEDDVVVDEELEQNEDDEINQDDEQAIEMQDNDNDDDEIQVVDNDKSDATGQDDHDDSTAEMDSNDNYEYEDEEEDSPQLHRGRPDQGNNNRPYPSSDEDDHDRKPPAKPQVPIRMERRYMDELGGHEPDDDGSSEEEVEAADDSSSDGNDHNDDDDNQGGDNEAVFIPDSEEEQEESKLVRHHIANYEDIRRDGQDNSDERSSGVEQYPNSDDEDSDEEGDDQIRERPHRIRQGDVDGYSSNASEQEVVGEPGAFQAVPVIRGRGVVDREEHSSDEEAFHQQNRVPQAADVVNEPIEIIDCTEDDDDDVEEDDQNVQKDVEVDRNSELVPTNRAQHPGAPRSYSQDSVARFSSDRHNEAARAMIAMFDASSSHAVNPTGNASVGDHSGAMKPSREVDRDDRKMGVAQDNLSVGNQESTEPNSQPVEQEDMVRNEGTSSPRHPEKAGDAHVLNDVPLLHGNAEVARLPAAHAFDGDDRESDASDDEDERINEVEKAETEVAAVGGEFGDTTEEESEVPTSSRANMLADAVRRADVLRARTGYTSHLEEGYEPEDTHGYTEEEVSEAIHTEDEEDERRATQEARKVDVIEEHRKKVERDPHSVPHSSDDMDAADEHTEHEEDLGAESSELEETTEARDYPYSPSSEIERDPTTLLEFAQSAQRLHQYGSRSALLQKIPAQSSHENASKEHSYSGMKTAEIHDRVLNAQVEGTNENKGLQSLEVDDDIVDERTSDNFASVEDDKEADSTMATESLGMTEGTVELVDSEEQGRSKSTQIDNVHEADTDVEDADVATEDRFSDEEEEENLHTTAEMAVDSHVESQDAMLAEESWPENSNQANLMETDSPAREHNNDMDVDENLARADDLVMVDGSDHVGDEVMEPEPLSGTGPVTAIEHVTMKEPTNDEASADEELESASPNADAVMETNPTSPVESHTEATVQDKVNHDESNKDNDQRRFEHDSPQVRDAISIETATERGGQASLQTEDLHRTSLSIRQLHDRESAGEAISGGLHGKTADGPPESQPAVETKSGDKNQTATPVRRSKRKKGTSGDIGPTVHEEKSSTQTSNVIMADAIQVKNDESEDAIQNAEVITRSRRQVRSRAGDQNRKDNEPALSEVSHPLDEESATDNEEKDELIASTPQNVHAQSMNMDSSNFPVVLVSRRARKEAQNNSPEKARPRVGGTPTTRGKVRKPVSEELEPKTPPTSRKRVKKPVTEKDESTTSSPKKRRGRAKKASLDEDESVTSTTRTTGVRTKKTSQENDESLKSPPRATVGRSKKTTVDSELDVSAIIIPRSTRGRAKKAIAEEDETEERTSRSTRGRATTATPAEVESVASPSRSTRGRAQQNNPDDNETVTSAPRTARGRTKKATTEEAESVTSTPRKTRGRAKKAPADDVESTASATPNTRRGQAKKSSPEHDKPISSATRGTRGRAKKDTTDDEESVVSAVHNTRSRSKKTDADESVTSAASSTKGANKLSGREDAEENIDESDSEKKPVAPRGSSRKGLPPLVPPRSSARTRSKK